MPLEPYHYRPATPPYEPGASPLSNHSRNTSGSSAWSRHGSPTHSIETRASTPSRSPLRHYGPTLLPKIRTQEQTLEPPSSTIRTHRRASSHAVNPTPQRTVSRPGYQRSTTSPPETISLLSPITATPNTDSWHQSSLNSPFEFTPQTLARPSLHARASSASRVVTHSRNSSNSSNIDEAALRRYGYPTYRNYPTYRTNNYAPSVIPGASTFIPPPITLQARPEPALPSELRYVDDNAEALSITEYLTNPNPSINLVPEVNYYQGTGKQTHFWWDIRNLRTWTDFSLNTIRSIPDFPRLLDIDIPATALPAPSIPRSRLQPSSEASLAELCRDHYGAKVNAALKIGLGSYNHIAMRAPTPYKPDGPHFVSNYQNDIEQTFSGNGRGRVVGLVKSYHRWNTGMRHEVGHKKVLYLAGLSHLQKCMREHGCRYGFILTEIELVCVRAGVEEVPYFGFLELSPAIRTGETGGLTVGLALWYLNMLAKDSPSFGRGEALPGQCGWRVDVGPPAAMTRMKVLPEKDEWIPGTQKGETRNAKTVRGWVFPGDPFHRLKEGKRNH